VFDGRLVCYPSLQNIRDYLSWRQADSTVDRGEINIVVDTDLSLVAAHINNLYNTCFWALVLKGSRSTQQAEEDLRGTMAAAKNEMLFSRFGINYNELPAMYKKGSIIFRAAQDHLVQNPKTGEQVHKTKYVITIAHEDIIGDEFWKKNARKASVFSRDILLIPRRHTRRLKSRIP
jgi:tRNA(His) guanylyltransferase